MEDNKEPNFASQDQQKDDTSFKVGDIQHSKSAQRENPFVNVRETNVGRIKKIKHKIGRWISKHHKFIVLILISLVAIAIGVFMVVCIVPQYIEQTQQGTDSQQNAETDPRQSIHDPYQDIQDRAKEILNGNKDNAPAVVSYYQQLIDEAVAKSDTYTATNLIEYAGAFFSTNDLNRVGADMMVELGKKLTDASLKDCCFKQVYHFAELLNDEALKQQYQFATPSKEETTQQYNKVQSSMDAAVQADMQEQQSKGGGQ